MKMKSVNLIMTFLALVTLGIGVYINKVNTQEFKTKEALAPDTTDVLSDETTAPSITPTATISPIPLATPLKTLSPSSKPTSTPQKQIVDTDISLFIYPGANVTEKTGNRIKLTSNDDSKNIISWYQNKLAELKMPARSVASTNTNGNILTKMAGASSSAKINVEITKNSSSNTTTIQVNKE